VAARPVRRADRSRLDDTRGLVGDGAAAGILVFPLDLDTVDRAAGGQGEAEVRALEEVGHVALIRESGRRIAVVAGLRVGGSRPRYGTDPRRVHARARR